jgi:hypothetical protein
VSIALKLAEVLSKPAPAPRNFYDLGPEAFGCNWPDDFPEIHGVPEIIGFRGEWYTPVKPSLRVRLHNWLIRIGSDNRDDAARC